MPLYVPKFHSGWEPPLDVLREAPWEVEALVSAPDDEVRAPTAPPQTHWPSASSTTAHLLAHLCPLPSPHTNLGGPFSHSRLQRTDHPFETPPNTALCLSPQLHLQETLSPKSAPRMLTGKFLFK